MIQSAGPVWQAFLGTLMTWGITALGGACVVLMPFLSQLFGTSQADAQRKVILNYFSVFLHWETKQNTT